MSRLEDLELKVGTNKKNMLVRVEIGDGFLPPDFDATKIQTDKNGVRYVEKWL